LADTHSGGRGESTKKATPRQKGKAQAKSLKGPPTRPPREETSSQEKGHNDIDLKEKRHQGRKKRTSKLLERGDKGKVETWGKQMKKRKRGPVSAEEHHQTRQSNWKRKRRERDENGE